MNVTNKLLVEVMKHPYIFDENNADYKNYAKHRRAWESISANITPNWNYLSLAEKIKKVTFTKNLWESRLKSYHGNIAYRATRNQCLPKKCKPTVKKEYTKKKTTAKYNKMNPEMLNYGSPNTIPLVTPKTNKVDNQRNMAMLKTLLPAFEILSETQKFQALHQFSVILNQYNTNSYNANASRITDNYFQLHVKIERDN